MKRPNIAIPVVDAADGRLGRAARRVRAIAVTLAVLAAAATVAALFVPIQSASNAALATESRSPTSLPAVGEDLQPLLAAMAGNNIIRPAQVQAAVKDDGAAEKMLAKLNLQGVIQMGDDLVAYVQVEKGSVQTVKTGDKLLSFVVEKVEPSKVSLSLQGVVVTLSR